MTQEELPDWFHLVENQDGFAYVMTRPLPTAYEIRPCTYGRGMYALKDFKKGDVVSKEYWHLIKNEPGKVLLNLTSPTGNSKFEMDVITHSILRPDTNQRELFGLDGFMNHSCAANTTSVANKTFENGGCYTTLCIRDIKAGDQITCDYDVIEWDCSDKRIDNCSCGAPNCRSRIWGFKHLTPENRQELLPWVFENILLELHATGEITKEELQSRITALEAETVSF